MILKPKFGGLVPFQREEMQGNEKKIFETKLKGLLFLLKMVPLYLQEEILTKKVQRSPIF